MSKRFLISVAAIALMAGAGAVNAQGMKNEGGGGAGMQQTAPSTGGGAGAAPTQKSEGMEHGKAGAGSDMKATQTEKSPGAMKNQRADESKSGGKDMKAEGREGQDKNMKAEGREGQDKNMKAEGREGQDKNMKAEGREGNKAAETNKSTTEKSTTTGQAGAHAKLSTEQRTKITTRDPQPACRVGQERELLDQRRHPRAARGRALLSVADGSRDHLSGVARL